MAKYVLLADEWVRATEWTDTVPSLVKKSVTYRKGDEIELNESDATDKGDIERLTLEPRPALRLVSEDEPFDLQAERNALAVAGERAAMLSSPTGALPGDTSEYPEGERVDAAGSTVGAGGTDPEPQGFTGEAGQAPWDDEEAWSYTELQAQARARGLSAGGSRVDLVARLRDFDSANSAPLSQAAVDGKLEDGDTNPALYNQK